MATIDGARACGLDDRIGTLEVGKQADVLMLRADTPNLAPMSDPVGAAVHAAGTHNVELVYVAGRPVKRDGTFVQVEVRAVIERAIASRDHLIGAAGVADEDWCPPSWTSAAKGESGGHDDHVPPPAVARTVIICVAELCVLPEPVRHNHADA